MLVAFCARTFACVLGNVHPKLNDVSGQHFAGRTLLRATAQPLAVDEGSVAAFRVLQVELQTQRQKRQVRIRSSGGNGAPETRHDPSVAAGSVFRFEPRCTTPASVCGDGDELRRKSDQIRCRARAIAPAALRPVSAPRDFSHQM